MLIARVLTALLITTSAAMAQQAIVAVQSSAADKTITVDLESVPLAKAIERVAELSGMTPVFDERAVSRVKAVSLHAKNITAKAAFSALLVSTGFEAQYSAGARVLIVPARQGAKVQGVITGKVTDSKTGKGVSGAMISRDVDTRGVVSDEDGSYRIVGVPMGVHVVTVRLVGYAKQTRSVTIGEGSTVTVDFKLEPTASVLNEVVVVGTVVGTELKAVPSAVTVITAKQIEERGITRIDQLFRGEIPGLFSLDIGASAGSGSSTSLDEVVMYSRGATKITSDNSSAVSITKTIKTYVDGVELSNSRYLSQIDPKSIERIEILTGPQASTIYGAGAINGVMQIFTKRGSTAKPNITLNLAEGFAQNNFNSSLASSHQYDGSISGSEGKMSYSIGSGWDYTGAWTPGKQLQRASVYGGTRYQSGILSLDLSARAGWTGNQVRGAISQVSTELAQQGEFVYSSVNSGIVPPVKRSLSGRTFSATLGFVPFSWWSHQLILGNDASDVQQLGLAAVFVTPSDTIIGSVQTPNARTSQSYSSTLRIPIGIAVQATLTYGGDHWRSHTTSGNTISWSIRPSGELVPGAFGRPDMTISKNSGAYVQGQLGVQDVLFFTYGVRADWAPLYGAKAKVRPGRYGVSYSKDFGIVSAKLRGSYGRSITPPGSLLIQGLAVSPVNEPSTFAYYAESGTTLYSTLPNPELGPEFQQGGEGGVEVYLGNRASLVITRYNQTVNGLINRILNVDSVRALQPGRPAVSVAGCSATSQSPAASPRSDGYCYFPQDGFLNVGSIRNQGWETQGSVNIGPFTTRGTYSWVKPRVIGITQRYRALLTDLAFRPGQSFSFIPEHTWALNVSYASRGTSVTFNVNGLGQTLRSGRDDISIHASPSLRLRVQEAYNFADIISIRLPKSGYATANMNTSHRFSSNLEATFQVTNLTNHYQNDFDYRYPTLGRQTRLGFRMRWQ